MDGECEYNEGAYVLQSFHAHDCGTTVDESEGDDPVDKAVRLYFAEHLKANLTD